MKKKMLFALLFVMVLTILTIPALAAGSGDVASEATAAADTVSTEAAEIAAEAKVTSAKAIGAAIAIGLAAFAGAIGMAILSSKSAESIARQPEAEGKIRTTMMLGLVFVETAIIYALIVAILLIFVL